MRELRDTMLRQGFSAAAIDRRITAMQQAFRDTEVTGYEEQLPQLQLPDPGDQHVLAEAIHAAARVIVTANVKDFPNDILAAHAIRASTPGDYLTDLIQEFPHLLLEIVHEQAAAMRQPPMTFAALAAKLAEYAPTFGALLREMESGERLASDHSAVLDANSGHPPAGEPRCASWTREAPSWSSPPRAPHRGPWLQARSCHGMSSAQQR
jgi:hypothetical protein